MRGVVTSRWLRWVVLAAVGLAAWGVAGVAFAVEPDAFEPDDPMMAPILPIDVPSAQDRTLSGFDMDFARFDLQAGVLYEFSAIYRPALESTPLRMTLWPPEYGQGISCSSLAMVTTPIGASATTMTFVPAVSGTYYLDIGAADLGSPCAYWLVAHTVQPWWEDQYETQDAPPSSGVFFDGSRDQPLQRAIDTPQDVDWFSVVAPEPGSYEISTGFSGLGLPPDTLMEVWDETGTSLLASNDDSPDGGPLSKVGSLTASATGMTVWRVKVVAAKDGMSCGAYTFSAGKVTTGDGRVFGTVTGPDGEPAAGARVDMIDVYAAVLRTTYAGADGTFAIDGVPMGVAFRMRADIEGAGLVAAQSPETRHLDFPEQGPSITLAPEFPEWGCTLQVKRPWISGWVHAPSPETINLSGMEVTAYDLAGNALGTATTSGPFGNYYIELPPYSPTQCKVVARDPSGARATTWYWRFADAASSPAVSIPTFNNDVSIGMPLASLTSCDQASAEIAYAGAWSTVTGPNYSGPSLSYGGAGCEATIAFQGTRIDLRALRGPTYGIVRITLDNGPSELVDLYLSSYFYKQIVYSRRDLAEGVHTVRIEYTGTRNPASTASRINIDAMDIVGTLVAAPAYPTRFDQASAEIAYGGPWSTVTGTNYAGPSLVVGAAGCESTVAFQGTGVDLVALTGPTYGIARVTLDSGETTLVDLYSATYAYKQVVYSRRGLSDGPHVLRIEYTGTRNAASTANRINMDAVDVVGALSPAPAYPTRFDQASAEIAYGGPWSTVTGTNYAGPSLVVGAAGCESTVAFQGAGVDLVALTGPTYGIARVTLDSGETTLVDLYSATYAYKQIVYSRRDLAEGVHTVRIEYTGTRNPASTASRINIDAMDIVGTLVAAPAYPTRFDQASAEIAYGGAWSTVTGTNYAGPSLVVGAAGCESTVAFQGTGVDLVALTGPTYGIARVTLDSGETTLVDLYSATYAYKQVVFSRRGLADGSHVLRIEYTGTRNSASTASRINMDAVDVVGTLTAAQ